MRLRHLLFSILAVFGLLASSVQAADTTPNQLSTEQQKLYLLPDGTWVLKVINVDGTNSIIAPALASKQPALGTAGTASTDVITVQGISGGTSLNALLTAGTAIVGKFGIDQTTPGSTNNVTLSSASGIALGISNSAMAKGSTNSPSGQIPVAARTLNYNGSGWDPTSKPNAIARLVSAAATTNGTSVKASSTDVFSLVCTNTTASLKFLKIYNKASAPTVGTDTPFATYALTPSNVLTRIDFALPLYMGTGFAYALTGAAADADTTALASGDVVACNFAYQ